MDPSPIDFQESAVSMELRESPGNNDGEEGEDKLLESLALPPQCPICLEPFDDKACLDPCFRIQLSSTLSEIDLSLYLN